jgi:hypothetical protein
MVLTICIQFDINITTGIEKLARMLSNGHCLPFDTSSVSNMFRMIEQSLFE